MARSAKVVKIIENDQCEPKIHNPVKPNNSLKIKIDDLKTFDPLTENQKLFYESYKRQDYFIALHGVAGTGKCIGEDELVDIIVSDELYEKLSKMI